ncbi:pseudaminic acid biosynthesis-associated methylase [Acetobacterium carbinolicum]|uniref:pseudaminic acid biosynthesis-associated methylase n=1 Tax=Acetobacterium carbinolicum TaxID=52690 RepID=UPI0039C95789
MSEKLRQTETEQEIFWKGEFGNEYIERNNSRRLLGNKTAFYAKVINHMDKLNSCIEFGSNIGLNLMAIRNLLPECELSAIEINTKAVDALKKQQEIRVYNQSILDFVPDFQRDLVIIHGVLIHVNPEMLNIVYQRLYNTASKYILIVEYYNPSPVEIEYRGNREKLFKRDFAGEMLDKFKGLELVEYGFIYHRDKQFPQDDFTWFLLKKNGCEQDVK